LIIRPVGVELFDVDRRMDGEARQTEYSSFRKSAKRLICFSLSYF